MVVLYLSISCFANYYTDQTLNILPILSVAIYSHAKGEFYAPLYIPSHLRIASAGPGRADFSGKPGSQGVNRTENRSDTHTGQYSGRDP